MEEPAPPALSPRSARRLAAARQRIARAKKTGPKSTVEAIRVSLISAIKINPSQPAINEIADHILDKIRDMYREADDDRS